MASQSPADNGTTTFLVETVFVPLQKALADMVRSQPPDPIEYLADWLRNHHQLQILFGIEQAELEARRRYLEAYRARLAELAELEAERDAILREEMAKRPVHKVEPPVAPPPAPVPRLEPKKPKMIQPVIERTESSISEPVSGVFSRVDMTVVNGEPRINESVVRGVIPESVGDVAQDGSLYTIYADISKHHAHAKSDNANQES